MLLSYHISSFFVLFSFRPPSLLNCFGCAHEAVPFCFLLYLLLFVPKLGWRVVKRKTFSVHFLFHTTGWSGVMHRAFSQTVYSDAVCQIIGFWGRKARMAEGLFFPFSDLHNANEQVMLPIMQLGLKAPTANKA